MYELIMFLLKGIVIYYAIGMVLAATVIFTIIYLAIKSLRTK